jgi:histidine decarboxylase
VPFFDLMINNIGDPWVASQYHVHTRTLEVEVLDFFARMFRVPSDAYWGYVTNGGTEGNMYGLHAGREQYPDAVVCYSDAAHYSIPKDIRLLRMDSQTIRTQASGEMDYAHLEQCLAAYQGKPVIIVATIGTTMTEARDNIATIRATATQAGVAACYIHCDAALGGIPSAFIQPHAPFDFGDGADSLSISSKFIGTPFPCGVVLCKRAAAHDNAQTVAYINTVDSTISGSRNGHAPLMLWYAIKRWGIEGFKQRTIAALELAAYTEARLTAIGWECWRNPNALTVVIKTPPAAIVEHWQLATSNGYSHLMCMPGISKAKIDRFVAQLEAAVPQHSTLLQA